MDIRLSRRQVLEVAGAAGALALAGGGPASAQAGKRIEQFAPELAGIVDPNEPIQELGSGFGGGANTEGPVWWKDDGGYLLFSSIGDNKRMKYTPGQGGAKGSTTVAGRTPTVRTGSPATWPAALSPAKGSRGASCARSTTAA